jgi:replicative DNA helicase
MFRPGEIATSEEIQRLREALGEQAQIDIDQAEDGTVQRISVQARRLSYEADVIRVLDPAVAAEPSASTNRVD